MVIDSSALIAILRQEPEADVLYEALRGGFPRLIAVPTLVEVSIVTLSRFGEEQLGKLNDFIAATDIVATPMSREHAAIAIHAFRRYGKGRHRAGLNYGDCLSYALAQATGLPLLFKGDDFIHTDVRAAV